MARPSVIAANLTITAGNNALRILLKINNRALYTGDRAATFIDQGLNVTQATPGEAGKAIRDRANAGIQRISDLPERTQGGAGIRHEVTGIVRAEQAVQLCQNPINTGRGLVQLSSHLLGIGDKLVDVFLPVADRLADVGDLLGGTVHLATGIGKIAHS